jgi:hypothetical protein
VTVQLVPPHPGTLQPTKVDPEAGVAVRVTGVPMVKVPVSELQPALQLMPPGELVTVPVPVPAFVNVRTAVVGATMLNVAVTVTLLTTVTVHGAVPLQPPPLQPAKVEPAAGAAVNVTVVPTGYVSLQSVPQLIPAGELLTVPDPAPSFVTVSVAVLGGAGLNVTVTV